MGKSTISMVIFNSYVSHNQCLSVWHTTNSSDFAGLDGLKTREIDIFKVRQLSDPLSPFGILPITSASKVKEDPMSYIPYIYIYINTCITLHYISLHTYNTCACVCVCIYICIYIYIHIQYIYTIIHIHIPMIFPIISHEINMFRCFL